MTTPRLPGNDPRTLARDIPGLFEALFPHIVPGVVAHLNRQAIAATRCRPVSHEDVEASGLSPAMLFELAVALAEQLLSSAAVDWDSALATAVGRQRRHFDARVPAAIEAIDQGVAFQVAENLASMLRAAVVQDQPLELAVAPPIPGYQWIASSIGDFSVGATLIEVKCTGRNFSSADYRQVLMYWLLSYASALERGTSEWARVILMNPRRCFSLTMEADELVRLLGVSAPAA